MTELLDTDKGLESAVSPWHEVCAYEALWLRDKATVKSVANIFGQAPGALPSDIATPSEIELARHRLKQFFHDYWVPFNVRLHGLSEYPQCLRDARNPVELFYYSGNWVLAYTKSVEIVGARKASEEGRRRARKLAMGLVRNDVTVVSGLAAGIDRSAHEGALEEKGRTIAVIGTPLTMAYPKENKPLQDRLMDEQLVISQVPFLRYQDQGYRSNRAFFPERNITMSALSDATVIVEASDTSGTLYQARAALAQGRKLFILDSCFQNPNITWPERFVKKGAIRVSIFEDLFSTLEVGTN